jgi:energy-coupling factor transporter ATP-binding protein EcfA2
MILRSIRVYGLFGEYDYDVELSNGSLTFIHSQNGMGKSTLMRLIRIVLDGDIEEIAAASFDRFELVFGDGAFLIVENRPDGPVAIFQKNEVDELLSPEDMQGILEVMHLTPDRLMTEHDGCMVSALPILFEGFTERLREAWADGLAVSGPGHGELSDAELELRFKELRAKLEFMRQAGFDPELPAGYRVPPSRFELSEYRDDYAGLCRSLEEYVDRHYPLAELAVMYLDIVNSIFTRKKLFISNSGELSILLESGSTLPVSKLSSGEMQILVIFFRLLFDIDPGSLVLIDEPEISLHVAWQHKLGRMFREIAGLRSLRMIITTHSPQIIHDAWDQTVELKVGQ